jgi:hypothetical protein
MARDVDPSYNTGAGSARAEAECSGSIEEHCLPSQFSKPYLMYSATDAASTAVNFAKGSLEDGVVNNPPSRDAARLPMCSPSPLQGYGSTPTGQRSYSLSCQSRRLYVLLRGSCIARRHHAARTKSMELAWGHLQNPAHRIHTSPDDVVMEKREVVRFGLNPCLRNLHHRCHQVIWS